MTFWGIVWVIGKYCLTLRLKSREDAGARQMERVSLRSLKRILDMLKSREDADARQMERGPLRSLKRIRGTYVLKRC